MPQGRIPYLKNPKPTSKICDLQAIGRPGFSSFQAIPSLQHVPGVPLIHSRSLPSLETSRNARIQFTVCFKKSKIDFIDSCTFNIF